MLSLLISTAVTDPLAARDQAYETFALVREPWVGVIERYAQIDGAPLYEQGKTFRAFAEGYPISIDVYGPDHPYFKSEVGRYQERNKRDVDKFVIVGVCGIGMTGEVVWDRDASKFEALASLGLGASQLTSATTQRQRKSTLVEGDWPGVGRARFEFAGEALMPRSLTISKSGLTRRWVYGGWNAEIALPSKVQDTGWVNVPINCLKPPMMVSWKLTVRSTDPRAVAKIEFDWLEQRTLVQSFVHCNASTKIGSDLLADRPKPTTLRALLETLLPRLLPIG